MCFNYFLQTYIELSSMWHRIDLIYVLGLFDIKQRYRRSKLGPLWLTISTSVLIFLIGLIFSQALDSRFADYFPYLACGIILWNFISSSINEGTQAFISAQSIIRQIKIPLAVFVARVMWRNILVFMHNIIIFPIVLICVGRWVDWKAFLAIPGFFILCINIFLVSLYLSVLCTRFRDLSQIVKSLLQIFFYLTPIIWLPSSMGPRSAFLIVNLNPVYHIMEVVRAPLLGLVPSLLNYLVSIFCLLINLMLASYLFGKYNKRVSYWL